MGPSGQGPVPHLVGKVITKLASLTCSETPTEWLFVPTDTRPSPCFAAHLLMAHCALAGNPPCRPAQSESLPIPQPGLTWRPQAC